MQMNTHNEIRIDLQEAQVNQQGEFEILAITAGEGNGWQFSAEVLRQSVPLWDGVESFIDHHWFGHSVHDLAGVCHSPAWSKERQGILLKLRALGPGAHILKEIGRQVLNDEGKKPHIGFSADLAFSAREQQVEQILRIFSVDLVVNPARGGEFIRQLNQKKKGNIMSVEEIKEKPMHAPGLTPGQGDGNGTATQGEAEKVRGLRAEMCAQFLESTLQSSQLPLPAQARLRRQFASRLFEVAELQAAIEDSRHLVAELTSGAVVQGARIHQVFDSRDSLQAAADDLLGAPREKGAEGLKPARLSGIRELYLLLTGDYDLHGGFDAGRAQFATTADFTGIIKNALNKIVVNTWEQLGRAGYDWWTRIARIEHFNNLNTITGTLVGTVGTLPTVAEGAEYTELAIGDSPETASFVKYGGYIPLTLELIDRDEARKLAAYPRELAAAGLRKISALVAAIFSDNAGVGPSMADGGALFNATAVTTAGGHANLLTTALSAGEWDVVSTAVYNQPMLVKNATGIIGTGPRMAINPRYCVVPRALQLTAMKVLYPSLENAANIYSENQQRGQPGDVVTVPEWTDANNWAAVCDPLITPAIYVGERFGILPEIFIAGDELSPAVFSNDEHRLKVRHFLACWVNDFRPLHKSNVA